MTNYDDTMGNVDQKTDRRYAFLEKEYVRRQAERRLRIIRIHEWIDTGIRSASLIGLTAILGYYRSIGQLGEALYQTIAITFISSAAFLVGMQVGRDHRRRK